MAYKKPICECGEELLFEVEEVQVVQYEILKNGFVAKRPFHKGIHGDNNWGVLVCNTCRKQYEFNRSFVGKDKFKMLRDEEIS
ncbi:hypothetical protein [Cohnella abietis]|uniref:Uncharacterized protein n=1 Tax=Cohnella abietis TaxID=2507935 RepID=A0A3T1D382_9BACL|nr:hypothetical protein [Cohnella abietis]BBI32465.1 hypothetical protein KCTCHS21_18640 [Cohnella abietis]